MKFSALSLLLGATSFVIAAVDTSDSDKDERTTFNGEKVPPLFELTPDNFEKEVKASKWMFIKHYR